MNNIKKSKILYLCIWDILFFVTVTFILIFNYNDGAFLYIPGYLWTNLFILAFMFYSVFICVVHGGKIFWNKSFIWPILFILMSILSVSYSFAVEDSIDRCRRMILMFLFMITIYQYASHSITYFIHALKGFLLAGTLSAIYLLCFSDFSTASRIGRAIGDPNLVGIILAFSTTIAFFLWNTTYNKIYLLFIGILGIAIILTGSRTAFCLLLVAIFLNRFLLAYFKKKNIFKLLLLFIVIAFVLIGIIYAIMKNQFLYDILGIRLQSFYEIIHGMDSVYNESSTQTRMMFIEKAFTWFLQSPFLLGNGINSFPMYNNTMIYNGWYSFSHCDYVELLSGVGIPGFVFFFIPYVLWLKYFWNSVEKIDKNYIILVVCLIVEFLLGEWFLCMYYEKTTWILFALLASAHRLIQGEKFEKSTNDIM